MDDCYGWQITYHSVGQDCANGWFLTLAALQGLYVQARNKLVSDARASKHYLHLLLNQKMPGVPATPSSCPLVLDSFVSFPTQEPHHAGTESSTWGGLCLGQCLLFICIKLKSGATTGQVIFLSSETALTCEKALTLVFLSLSLVPLPLGCIYSIYLCLLKCMTPGNELLDPTLLILMFAFITVASYAVDGRGVSIPMVGDTSRLCEEAFLHRKSHQSHTK